jgi:hypothetical protein
MRYLVAAILLTFAATSAVAQTCNVTGSSVVCNNGLTGNKTGNTTFWSDGTSSTLSGNPASNSGGTTPNSGRDNSNQPKNGAFNSGTFNSGTFNSDGTSAHQSGNATGNYQSCTRSGSALFCN